MMLYFGKRLRELRKRKGMTQEQLADALNLSPQAVSKWECGAGYPDLPMLPVIAGYFRISLDALLDYDPEKVEEKIQEVLVSARDGSPFETIEKRLLDGIAAYPGAVILERELLERYAGQIRAYGRTELADKALRLGKKILQESEDSFVTLNVQGDMADILISTGHYDAGKKIIESMPYRWPWEISDKMRCSVMFLHSEDALPAAREWKRCAHQELVMLCESEGQCFFDLGDYENALLSYTEAADLIARFSKRDIPAEFHLLQGEVSEGMCMLKAAACLYRLGRLPECGEALENSRRLLGESPAEGILKQYRQVYLQMGLTGYQPLE